MNLFKALFKGGNYHYVTTGPCDYCGQPSELTLDDEAYLQFCEQSDKTYNHTVCPRES